MAQAPSKRRRLDLDAVVDEAAKLCDEVGIEKLSISTLADRLGIRPPSLYNHIKSLDDLYSQLSRRGMREFTLAVEQAVTADSGERPAMALAKAPREFARRHPTLFVCATRHFHLPPEEKKQVGWHLMEVTENAIARSDADRRQAEVAQYFMRCLIYGFLFLEANDAMLPARPEELDQLYEDVIAMAETGLPH